MSGPRPGLTMELLRQRYWRSAMADLFTGIACLVSVGVFLLLFLVPDHEACQPVRKRGEE